MKTKPVFFLVFIFISCTTFGQHKPTMADSLAGFDELAARKAALSEKFLGEEFKVRMTQLKRKYLNDKYGLWSEDYLQKGPSNYVLQSKTAAVSDCSNLDFESSNPGPITSINQIAGWSVAEGYNGSVPPAPSSNTLSQYFPNGLIGAPNNGSVNSCNRLGCCPMPPVESELILIPPTGYVDQQIGQVYPIFSVFGSGSSNALAESANPQIADGMFGNKIIRLNSYVNNYSITRLSRSVSVNSSNALFRLAYMTVFSSAHTCCDGGAMNVLVSSQATGQPLSCSEFSISGPSAQCSNTTSGTVFLEIGTGIPATNSSLYVFSKWRIVAFDLSQYIGQTVNLDFILSDCTAGGHFSYAFLDFGCGFSARYNGNRIQVTSDTTIVSACIQNATLTAPSGLNSLQWSGPNNFSSTADTITTSFTGFYTLNYKDAMGCAGKKVFNIKTGLICQAVTTTPTICLGSSAVLGVSGTKNFHWSTGDTTANITVTPTLTTTYIVSSKDNQNCLDSTAITITVQNCATGFIEQTDDDLFSFYPNPTSGLFYLRIEKAIKSGTLTIQNSTGQRVYSKTVTKGLNEITVESLPSAIYYISVLEGKRVIYSGRLQKK